jgi:hypothetical protein
MADSSITNRGDSNETITAKISWCANACYKLTKKKCHEEVFVFGFSVVDCG